MQRGSCLIDITIIVWRHILYLVYLCPCQRLGLFMSYLLDLFFIFSLIFFAINLIFSFKQTYLFFAHFQNISYYLWMITWMKKPHNFLIAKVQPQPCCLAFAQFFLPISAWYLLTKMLLINKACILVSTLMLLICCSYANYSQGLLCPYYNT